MKLTQSQAKKICKQYNLGDLKSFKAFPGGLVNYNFKLTTEKGNFVLRILGSKMDDWKTTKFYLEQDVLKHLKKKKFPYKIPRAIKSIDGEILGKIGKYNYWIYSFLEGKTDVELNNERLKEIAKAISVYYLAIKDFKIDKTHRFLSAVWLLESYKNLGKQLKKIKNPNKIDKLMKDNFDEFFNILKEISKINLKIKPIVAHGDMINSNVLFKGNKIVGIIDFDNLRIAPRTEDIAYALRLHSVNHDGLNKKRFNLMLNEYERKTKLTKREKQLIFPLMLLSNLTVFWWMYTKMKKGLDKKYEMINWTIKTTKEIEKEWKNGPIHNNH